MNKPDFHPVTPQRHGSSWWHPFQSYFWASDQVVVPVFGSELAQAALHLPLAFVAQGDIFQPVAVVGLEPGVCLMVGGQGQWVGGYVPAMLRIRPFALLPVEDGRRVLGIDEAAGRVGPEKLEPNALPFFENGSLTPFIGNILSLLSALESERQSTRLACEALQKHGLLVPWPITLQNENGTRRAEGLFRVDEAGMSALPDDAFVELRRSGALPLAYAQLLSTQHMQVLGELLRAKAASQKTAMPVTPSGDLDLSFLERGDTLRFS